MLPNFFHTQHLTITQAKAKGIKFGHKCKIDRDNLLKHKETSIIGMALAKK